MIWFIGAIGLLVLLVLYLHLHYTSPVHLAAKRLRDISNRLQAIAQRMEKLK